MANQVLNLDSSDSLTIKFRKGQTLDLQLEFFEDDGTTPLVLNGVVTMAVSESPDSGGLVTTLISGTGLTVLSNVITIDFDVLEPLLVNPIYYWDIRNIKSDTKVWYLSKGIFIINKNITD